MPKFFSELKRRNVFRVAAVYLASAWLIVNVGTALAETFATPAWVMRFVILLLALGFPGALGLAWAFEITPEGLKRTHEVPREESITRLTGRKLDFIIISILALALVYVVLDAYVFQERSQTEEPAATGTEASIAVLPFADMSQAKDQEYFADGLSEELINLLAQIEHLRVIGRTSSFQFKGRNEDLRGIGEQLGVANILEGSVRKSGDTLRITTQLIRTSDGSHLWSKTYDRELDDVFVMQDEIAAAVVDALRLRLISSDALLHAARRDTEAYDQYLKGQYQLDRRTPESLNAALAHFQAALRRDPDDALAWVGLAVTYYTQAGYTGQLSMEEGMRLAREAAERAIKLNPELSHAHAALGFVDVFAWDWQAPERNYERAYALGSTDPDILRQSANFDANMRRFDRAIERTRQAISRDPLRSVLHQSLAFFYLAKDQLRDAEAAARRAVELSPDASARYMTLAQVLLEQRRFKEADQAVAHEADDLWKNYGMALTQFALGRRKESDAALEKLIESQADFAAFQIAEVYAYRGEADRAFQWFDRAVEQRDGGLTQIATSMLAKRVKDDPRYATLIRKIGLPELPQAQ